MDMGKSMKTAMRKVVMLVLFVALMMTTGCAGKKYGSVNFTSTPKGAEVINLDDGSVLGTTPVRVSFEGAGGSAENVTIEFAKNGYFEKISSVWVNKRHDNMMEADRNAIEVHAELKKK